MNHNVNMADKVAGVEAAAISVLKRAVEADVAERFDEAVVCYQEGLQLLLEVLKVCNDNVKKEKYREKMKEYMGRAEQLKKHVKIEKEAGKTHEQIQIESNSIGHSFESIFSKYLDEFVKEIEIEDPYIRSAHQICNLLRFCELVVKSKARVTKIHLKTGTDGDPQNQHQQKDKLGKVGSSLHKHGIEFSVSYSNTLHDREIRLSNGWVIKIGRGLDIYKAVEKFSVGYCDYDLRPCHETTVDIFHRKFTKSNDPNT